MSLRSLTILPVLLLAVALPLPALAQTPAISEWCQPGAAIDVFINGSWVASTVKASPDAMGTCPVHFDGFSDRYDESVGPDRAGPRGYGLSFAAGAQVDMAAAIGDPMTPDPTAQPRLASYHCVFFSDGRLNSRPGFTLQSDGTYTHDFGEIGTYQVNQGVVEFTSGTLSGQAGKVEGELVRMYNADRSNMLMDCEAQ